LVSAPFDKAKSGIYIDGAQNTTAVAELRTEASCPKEVNFFAVANSGYSDEQVGDTLVGSILGTSFPFNIVTLTLVGLVAFPQLFALADLVCCFSVVDVGDSVPSAFF
jgi:hypothetical protein